MGRGKKEEKPKDLNALINTINKSVSGRNPMQVGTSLEVKERLSTGVPEIDKLIGGGWVCGNYCEVYGLECAGKTTLVTHTMVAAQKTGYNVMYIDLEQKYDVERAESLGMDHSAKFAYMGDQIKYAEEVMDIIKKVCQSGLIKLIVIDSVAAFTPEGENETKKGKERSMSDEQVALLARQLSKFFRRGAADASRNKVSVLLVCQGRTHGIGSLYTYTDTTGGNAKKHYGVIRLEMRQGQKANAPKEKDKITEDIWDADLEDFVTKKKTVETVVGFEGVITVKKDHSYGCAHIGTELRLPFYFDSGFISPVKDWGKETKEESDIAEDAIGDGYEGIGEAKIEDGRINKPKKRGRPKKDKK